ncbi:MAG: HEAT repeat domain-containing protein [Verrucomicrobia bacterium]|nr:HEAT repeat domain-containing protein [Verrucomicrobiota bacterium]
MTTAIQYGFRSSLTEENEGTQDCGIFFATPGPIFNALALLAFGLVFAECRLPAAEPDGPNVPKLISEIGASDIAVRRAASYDLSRMLPPAKEAVPALIKGLDDQDYQVWFNSITALARIGPDAQEAIPVLILELEKSARSRSPGQKWYRAAFALGSIGSAAYPSLKEALGHTRSQVRSGAAKAISWAGPAAEEFVPALVDKLGDESSEVREQAAEALGSIGTPAFKPVMETLGSKEPVTRQAASLALEWLGESGRAAIPTLSSALASESDPATQASFIRTLSKLHCSAPEFVASLVSRIQDPSDPVRQETANALLLLEPPETTSVPPLVKVLEHSDGEVQKQAALLLGRIGPSAGAAVRELIRARMATTDEPFGEICQSALVQIGAPAVPALLSVIKSSREDETPAVWARNCLLALGAETVPALIDMLGSGALEARKEALRLLDEIGPEAAPSETHLVRLAQSADLEERALAILALASIPTPPGTLLPIAEAALKEKNVAIRRSGAIALAKIEKAARPALPGLIEALEDDDDIVASNAARAIGSMGTAGELAFPVLQKLLGNATAQVRLEAVRALGGMGEAAAPILPDFIRLLTDGAPELQAAVAESLGRLGDVARDKLPAITGALNHENASTRLAALDAFLRLEQDSRQTLPVLTNSLADADVSLRHRALESIEGLGRRGQSAEPLLFALLETPADRSEALRALRGIRADNVELLTGALANQEWIVRQFAADRLGQLGARATNAIPELEKLRIDEDDTVKAAARSAIRAIQGAARQRQQ